jgi:NHLM bacteriocin system ABC transporter ATP-binding protein
MTQDIFLEAVNSLGQVTTTGGNQSFPLTDPESVWYIAKGYVDVFSVSIENDQPSGSRLYFFTSGEGEFLFGIRNAESGFDRGLIAVPSPDAEIIRIELGQIKELWVRPEFSDKLTSQLELWIGHLSHAISKDVNPRTDLMIEAASELTLNADIKARSKKGIVWVEFLSGDALFLGMKEIDDSGAKRKFPISQDSWFQTLETSMVNTYKTADIILQNDFWGYLDNFYEVIFYCDFFNTGLNSVDEFNRLNEKALHDSRIRSSAFIKIASVLNDNLRKTYIVTSEEPILAACRYVADYAGITLTVPLKPKGVESFPLTLNDIIRSSRFRSRKVKLTDNWWKKDNGPLLAFTLTGNFPVALIPQGAGKYEYISPGEKVRQPLTEETASKLEFTAHQFYRPFPDQPIKGFDLIRFGMKSCVKDVVLLILVGLGGGLLTTLVPLLTGVIFDKVIPHSDYHQLYIYGMAIFFSIVAIVIFQLVRSFAMIRVETKLDFSLQSAIWDRLLNLPVPFFRRYQAGELAAKANSIMMLRKILSESVIYSVLGSIFMVFNFVLMFFFQATLSLYILGFLLIYLLAILLIGKKIQKHQRVIIHLQNRIFGMLIQLLSSISKIRIAGAEVHAFSQWAEDYSVNKRQSFEVRKLFLWIMLLSTVFPLLIILFVFAAISGQLPNTLSTGQFLAFYTALTMTVGAFLQLGMAGISYFMAIPLLESISPILETLPENVSLKAEVQNLSGEIEVANVSFRYAPNGPIVLDNVSMQIQPGEFVAIVGSSGSGKSTLLRLLLGFETPESGSVYYDRQDISTFDPASLRRQAGTVLQHTQLAAGNILTNIVGMTDATFEDAWEAARNVGLDEDIKQMPMGMYTVITGGVSTVSGGQRQRIIIARAIVNKPRILFFDEASSALDNKTQQIVSESLEKLQATRVVIAHRLTTVQHADKIYLMEHGKIVEAGTYIELINMGGKFNDLVKRQLVYA